MVNWKMGMYNINQLIKLLQVDYYPAIIIIIMIIIIIVLVINNSIYVDLRTDITINSIKCYLIWLVDWEKGLKF